MTLYLRNLRRKGSGDYIKGRAGQALGNRRLVYRTPAGNWQLADADALASMPVVGITMGRVNAGQIAEIFIEGFIGLNTWTWTRGDVLYASGTPGALTNVAPGAPSIAQSVAVAITPTMIYFDGLPSGRGVEVGGGPVDFTYLVERTDGNYTVYDDQGTIVHGPGADADTEINWALTTGGNGCVVYLKEGNTFIINDPITFTASNQVLRGGGRSTFINGDALATGEHAITISGHSDCIIRDLAVQTQDGGGKTCQCIFLEGLCTRTLIENVTIVDSDDNGIHIQGISHGDTRILNCNFLGADGHGIYSNMTVANLVYYLEVRDCRFTGMSGDGIHLEDASDCQIFDNVFATSIGGDGIELVNADDCHIENNYISGTTGYDINISAATCDRTRVFKNILAGTGLGCINDAGTDTILETLVFDFTQYGGASTGWIAPVISTSPGGIDIDANDEFAYCHVTLPNEVQEVVRITIWAYSNSAWAATNVVNMLLRIVVAGGMTTQAWNAEFIDVPNHPSEEDGSMGVAQYDVIHWIIDAGDDADLGDLADRDYLQVMAIGEAAIAPDLATDALFGGVEIEYV